MQNGSATRRASFLILLIVVAMAVTSWHFTSSSTRSLLSNSTKLAMLTGIVALPISAVLAFITSRFDLRGRRFLDACLLVLLFLPLYVQLAAWEAGFGRGGWYSALIAQRLSEPPLEGLRGSAWVHAMAAIPWLVWIFRLGFEAIPREFEEAAQLDGSAWQVFRRVTLPLSWPLMVGGTLFVAIVTMTEITVTDRYQFRSYAEVIYNEFALTTSLDELPLQLAPVALNQIVLVLLGLGVCRLAGARIVHATARGGRTLRRTPGPWLTAFVAIVVILLLGLPLANLCYQAGIEVRQVHDERVRAWSLKKCVSLIATSPWTYRTDLAWTAILAQLSILSSLSLAMLWTWWSYRSRARQLVGMLVCVVCFATPGTLIGLFIIRLLNRPNAFCVWLYDDTLAAPWFALTIKCLPFACLLVWHGMRSIPLSVIDSARVDGADSLILLSRIVFPLLRPSLICAALVCLAVSVGELSASLLVLPPDVTTVSSRVFSLIHYGAEDQLAGLCLSCVCMMAGLAIATRKMLENLP